ncbi:MULTISPECIES: DUF6913 domain-containing protein [Myroides]|uniref:DUF6913 domain-containing protein n=1 Tax=Myroides TaxID=76831 RepID=UPI0013034376|nr:hypothetical protein [Myroides phaeus]
MWFNTLKKRAIRKSVESAKLTPVPTDFKYEFKKIGIVVEKADSTMLSELLEALNTKGVKQSQVQFLVYSNDNKESKGDENFFKIKDFTMSGSTDKKEVLDFIGADYDLLISYYTSDSAPLLWVTAKSLAKFKVGISSVNTKGNHFCLEVSDLNVKSYIDNLFKYIKVFKK